MKPSTAILIAAMILTLVALSACGAAATEEPAADYSEGQAVMATVAAAQPAPVEAPAPAEAAALPAPPRADFQPAPNRLIIKNAELTLVVADTDVAMNRLTQAVADQGGYIVSTEIWYQEWEGESYKYATVTYAVPVDRFEDSLNRLRGMAEQVKNEIASGQDVTDEYVDLESRLTNLKATRDRIREFLDKAATVEEALKVNEQLKGVEEEIEQVQGRMNYLFDRAAYSTITVHLEPVLPEAEPTHTPTPVPTPTPKAWKPGETVKDAGGTLIGITKGLIDLTIWILVVLVPLLLPVALIIWLVWWLMQRRKRKQATGAQNTPPPDQPAPDA